MRFLSILGAGLVLVGIAFVASPQGFDRQKPGFDQKPKIESTKPRTQEINEIGGKRLEQWIKEITSPDRSKGENAIRTVVAFGPERAYEAAPLLIKELQKRHRGIEIDVSIRVNAVMALGNILGMGGADNHKPEIDRDAVKELLTLTRDDQAIVRYRTAEALGKMGPYAREAIPQLITLLHDVKTWETRQAAAMALGFVAMDPTGKQGPPENVVRALYVALKDKASQVRLAAIKSLTFLGGSANEKEKSTLVRYIMPITQNEKEDDTVRIWAHWAIMSITQQITSEHVHGISEMLASPELGARVQAAQALTLCGEKAKSAIPALIKGLRDREEIVVINCMVALSAMKASAAIPRLREIANDMTRSEVSRKAAQHAIDIITGKVKVSSPEKKDN